MKGLLAEVPDHNKEAEVFSGRAGVFMSMKQNIFSMWEAKVQQESQVLSYQ